MMSPTALRALADAARALATIAEEAAQASGPDADDLLPVQEAARLARCSIRYLAAARRDGDLVMYGKQRTRVVRRGDLLRWIEARKVAAMPDPIAAEDDDIAGRVARLASASPKSSLRRSA